MTDEEVAVPASGLPSTVWPAFPRAVVDHRHAAPESGAGRLQGVTVGTETSADIAGIVGKHLIYTYDNGWQYEMYVKNASTIDYRIHSGMVGGRWVRDQQVDVVRLAEDVYKISWTEPTGTSVCVTFMPGQRRTHGTIFFPRWVHEHPERTVCFQNEHLDDMERYRREGPIYPLHVVAEGATITFLEDVGPDDESLVSVGPADLPPGYAERRN